MAVLNLNITVPDLQITRLQTALRAKFGQVEDPPGSGTFRPLTNPELIERLRLGVIADLKNIVRAYEREEARKAAEQGVAPIDAT